MAVQGNDAIALRVQQRLDGVQRNPLRPVLEAPPAAAAARVKVDFLTVHPIAQTPGRAMPQDRGQNVRVGGNHKVDAFACLDTIKFGEDKTEVLEQRSQPPEPIGELVQSDPVAPGFFEAARAEQVAAIPEDGMQAEVIGQRIVEAFLGPVANRAVRGDEDHGAITRRRLSNGWCGGGHGSAPQWEAAANTILAIGTVQFCPSRLPRDRVGPSARVIMVSAGQR